jgi:hypothetical protein
LNSKDQTGDAGAWSFPERKNTVSVTFVVCSPREETIGGQLVKVLHEIYPDGFDTTPKIDPDYPEFGAMEPDNPWSLNIGNDSAREVLKYLGLYDNDELVGLIEPQTMIDRCDEALAAIRDIAGIDCAVAPRIEGIFVHCGRPAGYLKEQFQTLRKFAVEAIPRNAMIAYS